MKQTMRPRYFLIVMISLTIFAVIVVLVASGAKPSSAVIQINLPSDTPETLVERVNPKVEAGASISATPGPLAIQVTPIQDGQSLLESHCAQCHLAQSIERMKKSRTEWEKILEQMEGMGVRLDDVEKDILIDYLAVTDKP